VHAQRQRRDIQAFAARSGAVHLANGSLRRLTSRLGANAKLNQGGGKDRTRIGFNSGARADKPLVLIDRSALFALATELSDR